MKNVAVRFGALPHQFAMRSVSKNAGEGDQILGHGSLKELAVIYAVERALNENAAWLRLAKNRRARIARFIECA